MPIDDTAYRRLEEDARRQGGRLSVEDLGRALPIDTMSATEVAEVVDRLERAGIDVDVDPTLTRPHPDATSGNSDGVVTIASPAAPAISAPNVRPTTRADVVAMGDPHPHGHHGRGHGRAPTWNRNGVELLPLLSMGIVAVLLIVALA
ncbi:hypothetical protein [Azospirillum sp.]|uniref:hypothetical protein n=1 Tax=Azospirillum sp. TaxID=34012 RepID=UPI003D70B369